MHPLFEVSPETLNIFQLSDWITKCRTAILPTYGDDNQINYLLYQKEVISFCEDWQAHFELYSKAYNSKKYSKAMLYAALQPSQIVVELANGQRTDVTKYTQATYRYYDSTKLYHNIATTCVKEEEKRISAMEKAIKEYLKYGYARLKILISSIACASPVLVVKLPKGIKLTELLPEECYHVIDSIGLGETLSYERKLVPKGFEGKSYAHYVLHALRLNNINKNTYYAYINGRGSGKVKQRISKDFFTSLAFFLGLNANLAERLMRKEGYSIRFSQWEDDAILLNAFKMGYPRQYANILLKNAGFPSIEIGKD